MRCSKCGGMTKVVRPFHTPENETIRQRKCRECGYDMYTIESEVPYSSKLSLRIWQLFNEYKRELAERRETKGDKQ